MFDEIRVMLDPELRPYYQFSRHNDGVYAILIDCKTEKDKGQKVILAKSVNGLKESLEQCKKVGILLRLAAGDRKKKNSNYLRFGPLKWKFKILDGKVRNIETDEELFIKGFKE